MMREIRSCFVTGGTGFIGLRLVPHLVERGWRVRCLVRSPARAALLSGLPVEKVAGDLDDHVVLREAVSGVDAVLNIAGLTAAGSLAGFMRVNAAGARALARAGMEAAVPPRVFVHLSSLAAIGPGGGPGGGPAGGTDPEPRREEDEARPLTDYGVSKLAGERALLGIAGLPLVILRPPAVYGPGDRELLPYFRIADRGFFPLAGGDAPLSLVHVDDLARAVALAAERGQTGRAYHVAHPRALRPRELAPAFARALGRERLAAFPVPYPLLWGAAALSELAGRMRGRAAVFDRQKARELAASGWECDTTRAREEMGYVADIGIEVGLAMTALWYREQGWL
jgi:dihydroflavonol-4-reductase